MTAAATIPAIDWLSRRIHLVAGKGGVGRTTVAAAMAHAAAASGKRTLLTEIGDPHGGPSSIGRVFGREHLTPDPEPLGRDGLRACHVLATRGQELFAHSVVPAGPVVRTALRSKTLRKFVTAVPSLYELGVFFHLLTLLKETRSDGTPEHEVIVADMPATGQTLALTSLPEILLDALPDGPIPRYMREGQAYLNDPERALAWVVTLPEILPVTEAIELIEGLEATHVATGGVVLNRIPDDPFQPDEREALEALLSREKIHGELSLRRIATAREARRRLDAECDLPVIELPDLAKQEAAVLNAALSERWRAAMGPS